MIRAINKTTFCLVAISLVFGCGNETDSKDEVGSGNLVITASIEPEPPIAAHNTMHIQVDDAAGLGVAGLTLTLDIEMPSDGTKSRRTPTIHDEGDGAYRAYPITFNDPGHWQVTVTVSSPSDSNLSGTEVFAYVAESLL